MHFILFVLIGLIAGALAGRVVSGHGYGMLGDLIVGGKTPSQVRDEMKQKLAAYLKEDAVINVTVTGFNSYRFIVSGNVNHSGSFSQKFFITVSEAVAMAGGPNKFASDQIVILRFDPGGKIREIREYQDSTLCERVLGPFPAERKQGAA